jgi:hypothetical protein
MKNNFILSVALLAVSMLFQNPLTQAQAFVDVESGMVFSGYNDVQVPGDVGTPFSLKTDLAPEPSPFFRLRAGYTIKSKHTISALYAPLTIQAEGSPNFPIAFAGETFPTHAPIDASYTFNSYRLTYRYRLVDNPNFEFGLGLSGKIRDAEIALSSDELTASKTNVGFVPLINFRLYWQMHEKMGILFRGDALAAPQGRAEDVLLAGTYMLSEQLQLRCGYRILEGGADSDEVYNFTLVHYATVGVSYTFNKASSSN